MSININHQTNVIKATTSTGTISGFTTNVGACTYTEFLASSTYTPSATSKVVYVECVGGGGGGGTVIMPGPDEGQLVNSLMKTILLTNLSAS